MHTLSILQALSIWSDLEQAYHGTNSYGDEAEIYLYRLMSNKPMETQINLIDKPGFAGDIVREAYDAANQALYSILSHFSKQREAVITVEGQPLGPWLITARYIHRVHVKVIPKSTYQGYKPIGESL